VERGVPQRSVLEPLLWNIAYDYVLQTDSGVRVAILSGMRTILWC